jgi:hypothetical protein
MAQPKFCTQTCFLTADQKELVAKGDNRAAFLFAKKRQPRNEDKLTDLKNADQFFGDTCPAEGEDQPPEATSQTAVSSPEKPGVQLTHVDGTKSPSDADDEEKEEDEAKAAHKKGKHK